MLDVKPFSPIYMKYSHADSVLLLGENFYNRTDYFPPAQYKKNDEVGTFDRLGSKMVTSFASSDRDLTLVGLFDKNAGKDGEALLVVNCTDENFRIAVENTVSFTVADGVSLVTAYEKGVPRVLTPENGVYSVTVSGSDMVFITVE